MRRQGSSYSTGFKPTPKAGEVPGHVTSGMDRAIRDHADEKHPTGKKTPLARDYDNDGD